MKSPVYALTLRCDVTLMVSVTTLGSTVLGMVAMTRVSGTTLLGSTAVTMGVVMVLNEHFALCPRVHTPIPSKIP